MVSTSISSNSVAPDAALSSPSDTPQPAPRLLEVIDLLLRGQEVLSAMLRDPRSLGGLINRMLVVSVAGLLLFGLVLGAAMALLGIAPDSELAAFGAGHAYLWMPPTMAAAFLGALSICLPSFYFYTQLSGLDASFRLVTVQALRAQATTSVMLLGALPVYVALVLAAVLRIGVAPDTAIAAGFIVPFAVGLLGVRAVYRGFNDLIDSLPITHRRRGNFVRRLVLAWGAVYTAVAPIALYRIGQALSQIL